MDRKQYQREWVKRKRALQKPVDNTSVDVAAVDSETDHLFEADKPGYYIFDSKLQERSCHFCAKHFSTRLALNRFCSPACKHEYLDFAVHQKN
jgi:hypothetical protein